MPDSLGAMQHNAQNRMRDECVRKFLFDLTDPEMYGFAVTDEVRRRAIELLRLFGEK